VLFVEMEGEDRKQYPGLPKNWFPLRPTTLYWNLDKDDYISIARLGFPLVPNFSSTIHCATGQTLKSIIPDLGDVKDVPTPTVAMKGYIGLSRTTDAEGVLIARPFSPLLFQQGPQAHATALLDIMRRNSDKPEAVHRRLMEMETSRTQRLLRSEVWKCIICEKQKADCCIRWHDCMICLKSGMIRFNHAKKWHDWLKQSACGNENYPKPCLGEKKTLRQRSGQEIGKAQNRKYDFCYKQKSMRQRSPQRKCIVATTLAQDVIISKSIMIKYEIFLLCVGGYHATFKIKSAKGIR